MGMKEAFEGQGGEMGQAYLLHSKRAMDLGMRGVLDQCLQAPQDDNLGPSEIHFSFEFQGKPDVKVKVYRKFQDEGATCREEIEVAYDGELLAVSGEEDVWGGPIPNNPEDMNTILGGAIKQAFKECPIRTFQ